jgi:hypothetical protein
MAVMIALSAGWWGTAAAEPVPADAVVQPSGAEAPAGAQIPLVDGRALAVGVGFVGGMVVLNLVTGGLATPMLAGGAAETGMLAAGRMAGGRLLAAASGVLGGLVGDYFYRRSQVPVASASKP